MELDVQLHNPEAESAILGSILLEPKLLSRVTSVLIAEDFFSESNRVVYEALLRLSVLPDQPFNVMSLVSVLERTGRLELAGGKEGVFAIASAVPNSLYIDHYVELVRDTAARRRVQQTAHSIVALAQQPSLTAEEVLDESSRLVHQLMGRRKGREITNIGNAARDYVNTIDGYVNDGIKSGYIDLDAMTGGFQRSDLIIVAARPGVGKTSLALGAAYNSVVHDGRSALIFSLEMGTEQLVQRLIAMETGVDVLRLRLRKVDADERVRVDEVANRLAGCNLFIDDTPGIGIVEVRAKARQMKEQHGIDLLVIDYLQLMGSSSKFQDRRLEVDDISRGLKGLARELDIPVIAVAQLNRAVESRASHVPVLSDLRESGQLEQDADVIIFISREEIYDPETSKKNQADLHISKHRNGPLGSIILHFEKKSTRFGNLKTDKDHDPNYGWS